MTDTIEPGEEVVTEDPTLPASYRSVTQSAHVGYKAKLWKIVKVNGVQTEKVQVNTSAYNASPQYVTVGKQPATAQVQGRILQRGVHLLQLRQVQRSRQEQWHRQRRRSRQRQSDHPERKHRLLRRNRLPRRAIRRRRVPLPYPAVKRLQKAPQIIRKAAPRKQQTPAAGKHHNACRLNRNEVSSWKLERYPRMY